MVPSRRSHLADLAAIYGLLIVAAAYVFGVMWRRAHVGVVLPNYDVYGYLYPNVVYALEALRRGEGLLWNSLQNCGQPFFAISLVGLLYPAHALFLLFDVQTAIFQLLVLHLFIGGLGQYLLGRTLGLGVPAALCGAVAFEVGGIAQMLAGWTPINLENYVWVPVAMLALERLIQHPSAARTALLGVVLALQLLAGYPQFALFTYQLLALRLVWEIATNRAAPRARLLLAGCAGLALAPCLAAVQLLPSMEFAAQSVRNRTLTDAEIFVFTFDWPGFRAAVGRSDNWGMVFAVASSMLAALSLANRPQRRLVLFYLLAGALFFLLAFDNPVFTLYRQLPIGRSFRSPIRFLLVTAFAYATLVSYGADVLGRWAGRNRAPATATVVGLLALGAASLWWLSAAGLRPGESAIAAAVIAVAAVALWMPRLAGAVPAAIAAIVLWNVWVTSPPMSRVTSGPLRSAELLYRNRDAFEFVGSQMTLQDRLYVLSTHPNYAAMAKSGALFGLPAIGDYEPQTSGRYASLWVRLMRNGRLHTINDYNFSAREPVPRSRSLFDLVATRFVVADERRTQFNWPSGTGFQLRWERARLRVYENVRAMPRAYFVPRVEVVRDPERVLDRLASPRHDPLRVALVEQAPPGGDLGAEWGMGEVTIDADRSEEVHLTVRADRPGFVVLSDQLYPGWEATVNGVPAPITRANYAFRLVRVPAGTSRIVFRYRPLSVRIGAALSAIALAAIIGVFAAGRRRASAV